MSTADKRLNSKGQVDDGPIPFFGNSGGDTDLFGSLVSSQPPTQPNGWQNPSYNDKASIPPRSNSTAPVTQSAVSQPFSPQYPTPQRPKTTDPSVGQGSENVSSFFDNYSATQNVTAEPSRQSQDFLNSAQNSQDASFFDNPNYGQQIQGHEVQAQSPSAYNAYQPQSYADPSTQQYEAGSKDADWYTQNGYQQNAGYQGVEGAYAQQPQYQENYTGYQQTAGHDYGAYNENYYEGYDQQLASQQDPSAAGYYSHGQEYSDPNYVDPNAEYQNQGYTEGYGYDYTQGYDYNSSAYDPAYADYYQQQGYEGQYAEGGEGYIQPVGEAVATVDSSNSHYHQQSTYTHPTQVAESSPNYQGQEMAETQNYTDPGAFFESFPADQSQAHYGQDYSLPESSNGYLGEEAYSPLSFQDQTVPDSPAVALINPSEEPEISKQSDKGANEIQSQDQYISDFTKGSDVPNTNDTQEHSVPDDEVSIVKDNSDIFETAEDPVIKPVVHEESKGNDKKPPVTKPLEQVDNSDPLGQTEDIDINDPSLFDTAADMLSSFVGGASYTSDKPESPKSHDDQRSSFEQSHSQSDNLDDLDDLVLGSTSSLQDTGSLEKTKELTSESPYGFDTIIRGEASPDIVSLPSDHVSIEENSTQQTSNQKVEAKSDVISDIESIIKSPESSIEQSPPASTESISLKETDTTKGDEYVKKEESVEYNSETGNNPLGLSNLDVKSDVSFSQDKDESSKELSAGLAQPNHNAQFFDDIVSSSAEDQLEAVELPLDQDSQSNLNSLEQDSINDGVQLDNDLHQLPIETSSDVLKLPHDTQDLTFVNQESSEITNDAGDEVLTEANYQNQEANEPKYPEQGEIAEPEVEIGQKPIEKDPFEFGGVVAVDESSVNDSQEFFQNGEMLSPNHNDDVEQYHVNTDLKYENDASDAIPEHASDAQTHYHQNSYGETEYYQNNEANNLKSEQYEETPEMNTQQTSENGQHLDSNNDLTKNQSSWEDVQNYSQEYDFNEVPIEHEGKMTSPLREEPINTDPTDTQAPWEGTPDYYSGDQHGYSQEYYTSHGYQQHGSGDVQDGGVESTEQIASVQNEVSEFADENIVPNADNAWQTEGATYENEYGNYGYYNDGQYGSEQYGHEGAVLPGTEITQEPSEQYSSEIDGAVVPNQESYYSGQEYYQGEQMYDPNQGYYDQQEYPQYDMSNEAQSGGEIQHPTEQYSVQDASVQGSYGDEIQQEYPQYDMDNVQTRGESQHPTEQYSVQDSSMQGSYGDEIQQEYPQYDMSNEAQSGGENQHSMEQYSYGGEVQQEYPPYDMTNEAQSGGEIQHSTEQYSYGGEIQQEYPQYDMGNETQSGGEIQHSTEQYSVQDPSVQGSYGGVSEYYQGGQEYESNQVYYDQQSQHQYNLNQDTQSRDAGAIPPITNYNAGQHSVSYYNPNMGQGDPGVGSYYGTEGVARTDDPLGRTKGSPIVTFGFGGKMILMFPQVVTRFSTSSSTPVTKVYPGELKFHNLGNTIGEKKANSFPGPLLFDSEKSSVKARKKAVTEFLDGRISELSANSSVNTPTENDGQNEVILWKLLKVLCDHDGLLLGSPEVEKETLEVVFPASMHKRNEASAGISSNVPQHKSASPGALDSLQELLLKGDRSVATKFAMDNRLWAHALIIGSCVGKETWQQVVQKFTQEELTSSNDSNRESMTVMYNLFAGLGKDAIKDFIPESTNATQPSMFVPAVLPEPLTPKATSHLSQNSVSIEKLTKWRETIAMILANRTPGDTLALTSFGDLLRSQGWIYAAHICYLLSPQSSVHSGLDTPSVKTVLFGVDHSKYHACFARDLNALDRTEIYEHAISLRSSSPINGLPFLQPYKLQRAWYLADCGYTTEALRYCESIANIVKVHPKGSPYFHELFLEKLKELHERLTKSLGDKATSSNVSTLSWLTAMKKPTLGSLMDAVDRGLNRFIVGDSDAPKPKPEVTREITADPFSAYNPRVSVLQAPNVDVPVRSASVNDITSRYEHQRQFNHFGDTTHAHGRRSASPSSPSSAINQYEGIPMAAGRSYTTPFIPTNVRGEAESKITEGYESPYDPPKSSNGPVNEQHTDQSQAQSVNTWENTGYGYGYGYEQNNEYNAQSQPNDSSYTEQSNSNAYQYGWSQNPTSEQDNSYGYQATSANDVNDYSNNQEGQFVSLMSNSAPLVPTFGSADTKPYTNQYASSAQPTNDVDDDDLGFGNTSLGGRKQPDTTKSNDDSQEGQKEAETSKPETTEKSENKEQPENRSSWSLFSFLGRKKESGKPAPAKAHLPSGNNFYFDEAQNRWVNKAASAEESKPAALPPPPPSGLNRTQSASPTVGAFSGGPPSARSSPGPSMLAPPGPGTGMPRSHSSASGTAPTRRGVRNRYVDVMNPN